MSQWIQSSKKIGLEIQEWDPNRNKNQLNSRVDGWILTYQGASKNSKALERELENWPREGIMAIADEAHHLGVNPDEPTGQVWGKSFLSLTDKSILRIGLTGTPFRADNLAFCSAKRVLVKNAGKVLEQINPDLSVEPRALISAGDVRPLEFHFQDGWVEHSFQGQADRDVSSLSTEQRETWRARNLRRAVSLSNPKCVAMHLLVRAQRKLDLVRQNHCNAAGLVIARDIEHAKGIANLLIENGNQVDLVHSQGKNSLERLQNFQESQSNWLVSVDMCSEGFDAPRIRIIAYLTTVVTRSRFIQAITRGVRVSDERACSEPIPRHPSYVFCPADPLLIGYARNWSIAKPYLIKGNNNLLEINNSDGTSLSPKLPLEAVNDQAAEIIQIDTVELPSFLN